MGYFLAIGALCLWRRSVNLGAREVFVMAEKALILSGDPWDMTDEKTGQRITGVSLWYVNQYRDGENGQKPTKVTATPELFDQLKGQLPAVCEMEYGSRPGAQGKATLTVIGAKIIQRIDFSKLFLPSPAPAK